MVKMTSGKAPSGKKAAVKVFFLQENAHTAINAYIEKCAQGNEPTLIKRVRMERLH